MSLNFTFKLSGPQQKGKNDVFYRYGFFILMLLCMMLASIRPQLGGVNGILNGNTMVWYFAVPLTYLEAGLLCSPRSLYATLQNGYLLVYVTAFLYIVMPFLARIGACLLLYANVNMWLLKGMEVLYCMPPPFTTSLVLCRLAQADLPTSVVTTLVTHFGGLLLSPILLYFVLGTSTPPLVGINIREILYSTLIPLGIGIVLQCSLPICKSCTKYNSSWISQVLLLITAYHWFCDAVSADAASLQATDILLCVLIACVGQLLASCLCWLFCSRWLPRPILVAALFTSTHKSIGLGGWILRGAYHGSAHGPAVNLPLAILPVAQLLLGSLLASWLAP